MSHRTEKAVIIGAGVAGLAASIRLAVAGFHVTVYEKNNAPGGKLGYFETQGYKFDAGPSLFTQPQNIDALFKLANIPVQDYFKYKPVQVACNYFYEDGTTLSAYTDHERFAQELSTKLGEHNESVTNYLQNSELLYDTTANIFLNYSLHKKRKLLQAPIWKAVSSVKAKYIFKTLDQLNKQSFNNPNTVQLFNRYATYNGSNPYKAPAMLSVIPHLEYNQGVFYPEGGMISIVNALYSLAMRLGVQFVFNTNVQRIIANENKVKGIVVGNENILSDIVVSNIDVYYTYKYLLNNNITAEKILKQERSSSALVFYWGIKKSFPQLELHNIFFSSNYSKEFDDIFRLKKVSEDPTVYINITSKCEPGIQAPNGKENWFVMINAPHVAGQDWQSVVAECREQVIAKISRLLKTDIQPFIETENILTPEKIQEDTGSFLGSLYGTSSNSKMAAFMRHPNFSRDISGLYFCGGTVHPGGGIPLCLKSAEIMCGIIEDDIRKEQKH